MNYFFGHTIGRFVAKLKKIIKQKKFFSNYFHYFLILTHFFAKMGGFEYKKGYFLGMGSMRVMGIMGIMGIMGMMGSSLNNFLDGGEFVESLERCE